MSKEFTVWFDVEVGFCIDNKGVNLEFKDEQTDIEDTVTADNGTEAIEIATENYIDKIQEKMGQLFNDYVHIIFTNQQAEQVGDLTVFDKEKK